MSLLLQLSPAQSHFKTVQGHLPNCLKCRTKRGDPSLCIFFWRPNSLDGTKLSHSRNALLMTAMDCGVCLVLYSRSPNRKDLLFVDTGVQGQHASSTKLTHPEDEVLHAAKMLHQFLILQSVRTLKTMNCCITPVQAWERTQLRINILPLW